MFDPFHGYDPNWTPGVSCMIGWYGHLTCIQPKSQRVYVQLVEDDNECLYKNNYQQGCDASDEKNGIHNAMDFFYMMDKDVFGVPEPTTSARVPNPSPKSTKNKSEKVGKAKSWKKAKNKRKLSE